MTGDTSLAIIVVIVCLLLQAECIDLPETPCPRGILLQPDGPCLSPPAAMNRPASRNSNRRSSSIPWRVATPSALARWRLSIWAGWILLPTGAMSSSRISSLGRRRPTTPVTSLRPGRWRASVPLWLRRITVLVRRPWWRLSIGPRSWGAILIRRRRVTVVLLVRLGRTQIIIGGSSGGRVIGLTVPI